MDTFFIDFDHTLFDVKKYKAHVTHQLTVTGFSPEHITAFWSYEKSLRGKPHFLIEAIKRSCEEFSQTEKRDLFFACLLDQEFEFFIFPDVLDSLVTLKKKGRLILFTQGDELFQQVKIFQSKITFVFDVISITDNKLDHFIHLIHKNKGEATYYIDDNVSLLAQAKKLVPEVLTVHITRYDSQYVPLDQFRPDFTVVNLTEFTRQFS